MIQMSIRVSQIILTMNFKYTTVQIVSQILKKDDFDLTTILLTNKSNLVMIEHLFELCLQIIIICTILNF